jgi:iron complex outermembrane receptor protein
MSLDGIFGGRSSRISLLVLIGTILPFTAASQTLEEIIVTAQKRAESVQDVPIAITALDSAVLERNQIENIEDLTNFVPNLQFGNFSSTATAAIRGIGYTNTTAGGDPGVALHLDGVYIARPIATAFRFWDLERMEVLRGPQGTLYGRNTTGGSINFITKRPTQDFGGAIDVAYGEFDHYQVRGVVNLPLSERTAARISAAVDQADGYQENAFPGGTEAGDRDSVTVRAQLQFDISDDLDLYLSVNHSQVGGVGSTTESRFPYPTNPALNWVGVPPPFVNTIFSTAFLNRPDVAAFLGPNGISTSDDVRDALGLPPGALISPSNPNFTGLTNDLQANRVSKNSPESNDQEFTAATAILTWDTDLGTLKWTSAYVETSFDSYIDLDASELTLIDLLLEEKQDQVSTEITLSSSGDSRTQWIAGAYFFAEDATRFSTIFADDFDRNAILFDRTAGFRVGGDVEATSYALFGQVAFDLSDTFTLTAGGRMSWDEKDAIINLISPFPAFNFMTLVSDVPVGDSWNEPTGKVTLDWSPRDDLMLYASYAHGYKSGGINLNGNPATNAVYDPEFNDVFEIGIKSQFAERYQINAAAFHNDYTDIQVQTFGAAGAELRNAAEATIQGLELEGLFLLTDSFELNLAVGLLDAEFDSFLFAPPGQPVPPVGFPPPNENPAQPPGAPSVPVEYAGNKLSRAPELTFSAGAEQRFDVGSNGSSITIRADYYYQDTQSFSPDNRPDTTAASYSNLDVRLRWDKGDNTWSAEAFVLNATDEDQIRDILRSIPFLAGGVDLTTYRPPQQWGVRVGYRF